jgi:lysyl-tRNA synthetase class 2
MPHPAYEQLLLQDRVCQSIRRFFQDRNFLETRTPVRIPAPAPEQHIDPVPSGDQYLRTSPELQMKRLLAAGCRRIYQLGPCFRNGEHGSLHNPEFTMLEWYRTNADYMDILDDTRHLLRHIVNHLQLNACQPLKGLSLNLPGLDSPWLLRPVRDVFREYAGWDPVAEFNSDRFDIDLIEKVEPRLPRENPVVLYDYPAPVAALAQRKPDNPEIAERWELYINGIELANAYSELTDPKEQLQRFEQCIHTRSAAGKSVWPIDPVFMDAIQQGIPRSGGIALGLDRLFMLLSGKSSLDNITWRTQSITRTSNQADNQNKCKSL